MINATLVHNYSESFSQQDKTAHYRHKDWELDSQAVYSNIVSLQTVAVCTVSLSPVTTRLSVEQSGFPAMNPVDLQNSAQILLSVATEVISDPLNFSL